MNSLNRDKWVEKPKYIYCDNCNEATPVICEGLDKSLDSIGYGYFLVCKKCKEARILVYTALNHHKKTKKQVYPPAYYAPPSLVRVVGQNPYFWKYSKNKTVFKIANLIEEAKAEERKRCLEIIGEDEYEEVTPTIHGFEWNDKVTQGRNELRQELRQAISAISNKKIR